MAILFFDTNYNIIKDNSLVVSEGQNIKTGEIYRRIGTVEIKEFEKTKQITIEFEDGFKYIDTFSKTRHFADLEVIYDKL